MTLLKKKWSLKIKLALFFLFSLLLSCSTSSPDKNKGPIHLGVDIADKNNSIKISENINPLEQTQIDENVERVESKALYISEGIYYLPWVIGVLNRLERDGLKFNLVGGSGLGAVLALMYAYHGQANLVEWNWYKLENKLKNLKFPYSRKWKNAVLEFINEQYPKLKFSDLKTALYIPVCRDFTEIKILDKGYVVEAVEQSLRIENPERFQSCIGGKIDFTYIQNLNIKRLWRLDSLPVDFELKYPQGYLYGILNAELNNKSEFPGFSKTRQVRYNLTNRQNFIDELKSTSKLITEGKQFDPKKEFDDFESELSKD